MALPKNLSFLAICIFMTMLSQAQNTINIYKDWSGEDYDVLPLDDITGEFLGELQWYVDYHHWTHDEPFKENKTSLKIEAVSFPFVINADRSGVDERILTLPTDYDAETNIWDDYFHRLVTEDGHDESYTLTGFNTQSDLASALFCDPGVGTIYPHTILKFTMYYHCGPLVADPIVDSLSFIIDFTRGRMRYYPFENENFSGCSTSAQDIGIRNKLELPSSFEATTNILDELGDFPETLDYFPIDEAEFLECESPIFSIPDPEDEEVVYSEEDPLYYFHPAPYTLQTIYLTGATLDQPAGYDGGTLLSELGPGIKHSYVIDENIDLTIINPWEKVIYNPSEVDIEANDLVFPSGYTFKTVRGVYPSTAEVEASTLCDDEIYVTDPRQIPVTSDLEDSPSIYTLVSGSKLTIEPCVYIFDATFIVEDGAELDYSAANTYGNFTIVDNGGTIDDGAFPTQKCNNCVCVQEYDIQAASYSISTNTTWNTDKSIMGAVHVLNGKTLTINNGATIRFADSRRTEPFGISLNGIVVEKGGKLIVDDATLTTFDCDKMWDGIQVWGTPSVEQSTSLTPTSDYGVVDLHDCTIENARGGVDAGTYYPNEALKTTISFYTGDKSGGVIRARGVLFHNNYIGVFYGPYTYRYKQDIVNCVFSNDQLLGDQIAYKGYSLGKGVMGYAANGIAIKGCDFINTSSADVIDQYRGSGVFSIDAEIAVVAASAGTDIPTFTGLYKGISTYHFSGLSKHLKCSNAIFTDCVQGITTIASHFDDIRENTFHVPDNYRDELEKATDSWAVYSMAGEHILIEDNIIDGEDVYEATGSGLFASYGIIVSNSGDAGGFVYRNTSSDVHYGLQTEYANDNISVECNDYTNHFLSWLIGLPIDEIDGPAPTFHDQGSSCDIASHTANNLFDLDDANDDIYSPFVEFDYYAYGYPNETVPENAFGSEAIIHDECPYEVVDEDACSGGPHILEDFGADLTHVDTLINQLGRVSNTAWRQTLLNLVCRYYFDNNQPTKVNQLLQGLNNESSQQTRFYLNLQYKNYSVCQGILNALPLTTTEQIEFKKLGKVLISLDSSGRNVTQLTSTEETRINHVAASPTQCSWNAKSLLAARDQVYFDLIPLKLNVPEPKQVQPISISEYSITVYPNPSSEYVIISSTVSMQKAVVELTDMTGKVIMRKSFKDDARSLELIVSDIESGLYIVSIYENGRKTATKKLIVSK